jgi:hypothetical protein
MLTISVAIGKEEDPDLENSWETKNRNILPTPPPNPTSNSCFIMIDAMLFVFFAKIQIIQQELLKGRHFLKKSA